MGQSEEVLKQLHCMDSDLLKEVEFFVEREGKNYDLKLSEEVSVYDPESIETHIKGK